MRRLLVSEGSGVVRVHRDRAHVYYCGRYVGRLTRQRNGRWRAGGASRASYPGPAEAAEDAIEQARARP